MSVTITLTDPQRTEALMVFGFARECAAVYELYAPRAVKPYWVQRRDTAQELFDLLNEARRDAEDSSDRHLPCGFRWTPESETLIGWTHLCSRGDGHSGPHRCICGGEL